MFTGVAVAGPAAAQAATGSTAASGRAAAAGQAAVASPGISAPPDVIVGEADGHVSLAVRLSAPGKSTVSVNYATANSTAGSGTFCNANYVAASGTLTFPAGTITKTVQVTLLDCHIAGFVAFTFNLSTPSNATITRASTRVGIVGDPAATGATPGLYVRSAVVDNTAGTVSVPVMLGGPAGATSTSTVTVNYATKDGSAVAGTDYTTTSGKLTFNPGQTVKNISVKILDRTGAAPTRSFTVTLSSATNATIVNGTGVVTIGASGATAVASPQITAPPDVIAGEADGYLDVPVTLSAPGKSNVTVDYATANSTAGGGTFCNANYVPVSGTLTFVPGVTTQVIRIDLLDCHNAGFVAFTFGLTLPGNATITRPSTRVGIVGDPAATGTTPGLYVRDAVVGTSAGSVSVPVMLGGPAGATSTSTVTVSYTTSDGSAVAGTDYTATSGKLTFGPGQTLKNITVPILDRTGAAPTRSFTVSLSSPTNATIVNGTGVVTIGASGATAVASPGISAPPDTVASAADGYLDVPVTLSAPGKSTVTVSYATANSTAGGGTFCNANYVPVSGTLTFIPGVTTQVIRIDLLDCHNAGFVAFTFNLTTPVNATVTRPGARIGIVGDPSATGTPPGLYVRDAVVDTSAGSVSVPVMLGGPAGATSTSTVTVNYATKDGSAVAGTDYTATSGKLTFGPGQTVKNITVPILDRTGAAPTRSFTVTLTKPGNATIGDNTGVVTIGASGAAAVASPKISAPLNTMVGEASGYLDVPVTLSAPGKSTVTVNYATANGTASGGTFCNANYVPVGVPTPGTLTFIPGVTTRVVRIDLLSCGLPNPGTFTFNLTTPVNGTITRATTTITIVENPGKPGAPTHATAVAGKQSATVSFTAPKSDGGDPINSYTVTSSPGGIKASGSVSPITVTGLTSGVSYTFQVTATNSVGTGPKSKPSNAVVPSVPVSVASLVRALAVRG